MRDTKAEFRVITRLEQIIGGLFLLGILSFAAGVEIIIIQIESTPFFWIWQGVWAIAVALVFSTIVGIVKKVQSSS